VFGIDAYLVEVEVDIGPSYQGNFNVVGLPDIAVKESRERIQIRAQKLRLRFPDESGVTVNLAPAVNQDLRIIGHSSFAAYWW
jgi:magnesium chelatase family protein